MRARARKRYADEVKHAVRALAALTLAFAMPLTALAQTHVVAQLGTSPLIGSIDSTPHLQQALALRGTTFRAAGAKLGLSAAEYRAFARAVALRQFTYVTIPRRLDAMSWAAGGNVYVIRDVLIPSGTRGWEVDLHEDGAIVALFVPARCGNLSLVRRAAPRLARAAVPPPLSVTPEQVASAPVSPIADAPSAPDAPALAVPPVPDLALAQAPAPRPYESLAASAAPARIAHLWPLLLLPLVGWAASHGPAAGPLFPAHIPIAQQPGCPPPPPRK